MPGISVSVPWAISQYRAVLTTLGSRTRKSTQIVRVPRESPEVLAYLGSIGIGRNIDVYA